MQKLTIHPELKSFQARRPRSYIKHIKESILKFGCFDAILEWNGTVIDGHLRYAVCKKHKILFKTTKADFKSIEDAKLWIYENLMCDEERSRVERPQPMERSEKPVPDGYLRPSFALNEEFKMINLRNIRIDLDTQSRVKISQKTIKEYVEAMKRGADFPEIRVFQIDDSEDYVLVDGFHRYYSYMEVRPDTLVSARIKKGTLEEARWAALAANQKHGLQRTKADKKKSILHVLQSEQGTKMSNRQIADYLGVNESTVRRIRHQMESTAALPQSTERVGKDGRTIKTENIGKTSDSKPLIENSLCQKTDLDNAQADARNTAGLPEQIVVDESDESTSTMTFTLPIERVARRLAEHFFTYFDKKFVNDLVISAVELMDEKVAPGETQRLLNELNVRFGKRPAPPSFP
ncbi:MAG: helix-turn-helix domain-containing protein, partial [Planctomycetaceae bacterium]|nr:helix-turn-helix domain-containing protein [Planctomycetaceae bacterium]